jgi:very-short-patch-repair endonuclease
MDERLTDLAQQQGGLVTRRQLRDLGIGDKTLATMVRDEALARIAPGRYRVSELESWVDRVRGLRLLAGRDAIAARGTSARLQEIEGPPAADVITLYVPHSGGVRHQPGLLVRRCELDPAEIWTHDDIPCTAPLRTVVDCARFLPHPNAVATIEGAIRKGLVSLDEVTAAIERLHRVEGAPAARRALRRVDLRSQSLLETEARLLLLDAGVDVEPQVELGNWHADLGVRGVRLAIELQGGSHRSKEQQQEDETKRAAFLASKWEIVGFTADDVRKRHGYVVAVVRRLVDMRARATLATG